MGFTACVSLAEYSPYTGSGAENEPTLPDYTEKTHWCAIVEDYSPDNAGKQTSWGYCANAVTDPPVTDEPVTDPPVTDEPVTDPPVTDEPVTAPPTPGGTTSPKTNGDDVNAAAIAVPIVLVLLAVAAAVLFFAKKKREQQPKYETPEKSNNGAYVEQC